MADNRLEGMTAANVAKNLSGVNFPADRNDLAKQAESNNADKAVVDAIRDMPDRKYQDMADVEKGLGEAR